MFVDFSSSQDIVDVDPNEVANIVTCILKEKKVTCDEVSIHFVSKEEITDLHGAYFDDPTPTDCITFPIDDSEEESVYKLLGEVFVCPEVALEYAKEHDLDFEEELTLYIVHGILHLLGYDDIEEADRALMRKQESLMLSVLSQKKLILTVKNRLPYVKS